MFWICLAVLLLGAAEAWARAGGGGDFAGGGGFSGGGGGSGGGGDGDAFIIYLLLRYWLVFCIHYPLVGIPLTIVGIVLFIKYGHHFKTQQEGGVIRRGLQVQQRVEREAAVASIRDRDPAFNEQVFLGRVGKAFLLIQEGWSRQDLGIAQLFISDGIAERFALQFEEQRRDGYRNDMTNVAVQQMSIAQVESDAVFDTITVRIAATATDTRVDLKNGKVIPGRTGPSAFVEYWSFARRPGARTLDHDGVLEGNCPNCGAGLVINENAKCTSCGAVVRSGEYDWVLTEITQECEWAATSSRRIPGVEALRADDPGFCPLHLEDLASVMFWRTMAARRAGSTGPLRHMALDAWCEEMDRQCAPDAQGRRRFYRDAAVGAVDTEGILRGGDFDRAVMGIRWSGALYSRDDHGEERKEADAHVIYELYILARRPGVKTDVSLTFSSAHCPSCGAAVHHQAACSCEYCGATMNDGGAGWALEKVVKVYSDEARRLRAALSAADPSAGQQAAAASAIEQLGWMISVMLADGVMEEREQETLFAFAKRRNIPDERVEQMISAMKAGQLECRQPATQEEANAWLETMAAMALADGHVTAGEKAAMINMAKRLRFAEADILHIIQRTRTRLYREGRAAVKADKSRHRQDA